MESGNGREREIQNFAFRRESGWGRKSDIQDRLVFQPPQKKWKAEMGEKGKFRISLSAGKADGEGKAIFRIGWYSNPPKKNGKRKWARKGNSEFRFPQGKRMGKEKRYSGKVGIPTPPKKMESGNGREREIQNFAFRR